MNRYIQAFFSAVFLLCLVLSARAQTPADPSGHWEGLITWEGSSKTPAGETAAQVDLKRDAQGQLVGEISVPGYKVVGRPLVNLAAQGPSITFQIALSAPGDNTFKGIIDVAGKSISGDFTYQGTPLSFTLNRTGDSRMEVPAASTPITKELDGAWKGTLVAGEKNVHLVLNLTAEAGVPAKGVLITVDQGNMQIPITTITQKAANLTLDVKLVGGSYSGVLNSDGTSVTGTWTQGALLVPLTFTRAVK